uniref:DSCAM/DSCAML C-terminal domain-containing protein n=1 Tax=Timema poppense TaxID=170557 RepID=A0A7R9DS00_TIMPO|nr:unnamed protein product [Timema poppensis]
MTRDTQTPIRALDTQVHSLNSLVHALDTQVRSLDTLVHSRRVSILPPTPLITQSSEKAAAYLLDKEGNRENKERSQVSNNILPQQRFPLVDLMPGTRYFLRVAGHNHAGSTLAEYDFTTLSPNTGKHSVW